LNTLLRKLIRYNMQLPNFSLSDYLMLIENLRDAGYVFHNVSQMVVRSSDKIAYMCHDIDLHISLIDTMAKAEASHGVTATYYVLLTQHYNPLYPDNQRILRMIQDLGHEIGLHYDMETYPTDPEQARKQLDWEVSILSEVVGEPIRTIRMHWPRKGQLDPFVQIDEYVHSHDPRYQEGLLYVSDSCRAWRDESLLTCFGLNPPRRLLLNTHPELWLDGTIGDRIQYLDQVLMENIVRQYRDYFDRIVRPVWKTHPAPRLHDERESRKTNAR